MDKTQGFIFVDLDGTLLRTDTAWEALIQLLRQDPFALFSFMHILSVQGKAAAKSWLSERSPLDVTVLPYNETVRSFLLERQRAGDRIVLATAADERVASSIVNENPWIEHFIASDGRTNLSAHNKLDAIRAYATGLPFAYIGDSRADVPIWRSADTSYIVRPNRSVNTALEINFAGEFVNDGGGLAAWIKSVRPYQWTKNLLIFVPLLLAFRVADTTAITRAILAWISFSLAASAIYVLNDLFDLNADRRHPEKKERPFASGSVPIPHGLMTFITLSLGSYLLSWWLLGPTFLLAVIVYQGLAIWYSASLKHVLLVDVFVLTSFYVYRLFIGSIATSVQVSTWLFVYAFFFFLSLALMKRYAEIVRSDQREGRAAVRAYQPEDASILALSGIASGFISSLVLLLYIQGPEGHLIYKQPLFLILDSFLILFWLLRMWILVQRREVKDDPLLYALHDATSYIVMAGTVLITLFAYAI